VVDGESDLQPKQGIPRYRLYARQTFAARGDISDVMLAVLCSLLIIQMHAEIAHIHIPNLT